MKNWDNIAYQTIKRANLEDREVTVEFNDGTVVNLEISSLLPFATNMEISKLNSHSLTYNPYEIMVNLNGKEVEIPWDKIRVLTDMDFGKFVAEKAEEQARLIGVKLKRLRERKGIKNIELAERSGIAAQTISRIEKGHTDVGFSTLRKLLACMGYSLKDLATEEMELQSESGQDMNYNSLLGRLGRLGLDSNLLVNKIIPKNIHAALSATNIKHPNLLLNEAVSYISTVFGWTQDEIWKSNNLQIPTNAFAEALFKMPANANINQIKAYAHYGYYLSKVSLKALIVKEPKEYPQDTKEFKTILIEHYAGLDLESILRYAWDMGIVVLPLNDSGLFHGASWNIAGRHVIIVKQNTKFHSRWIFDLLHELYHVFDHLQEQNTSIVEIGEISPFSDDESVREREANSFANLVLFDGKAEEFAQESVEGAKWNLKSLGGSVRKVAKQRNVREDSLANYMAFRLSFQNQNWWAQANSLQIQEPHPFQIATNIMRQNISFNKLNPIESNLLKMAIDV
jgi:transcriptional regulator with XRE-family HTH domain/Zn-dependent peptidase ImmA (M78 family)